MSGTPVRPATPPAQRALLSVRSLSRTVARRTLVDAVSFDLGPAETLAVLGPSGSGKTSLLRLIAGFDAPTGGELRLDGETVSATGRIVVPPERRRLALTFQDATLLPHLDAVGNVAFAIRRGDKALRTDRAREALRAMGLDRVDGRDVSTLSGGEAQRVSLARALAAESRLLLLDEPFGNVDRPTRADLLRRLKARLDGGLAAIIVTHDPADARELGARVLLMREGRLVADGTRTEILEGRWGRWARIFLGASE